MSRMRQTTIFAVLASALMLVSVAAPAMAIEDGSLSVSVSQSDTGEATVTVSGVANNSSVAVENASVTVETVDENATYEGTGEYTTDANGTVTLAAPNETVDVSVTATSGNQSASTTATLVAGSSGENESEGGNATAFGQRVSSFVHMLQSNTTGNSSGNSTLLAGADDAKSLGVVVATFVTANNPGNQPDHAGPPAWLLDDSVNKTTGPPDRAGAEGNDGNGPPEDKGKSNNANGPPEDKGNNGNGPPEDKGKNKDATATPTPTDT